MSHFSNVPEEVTPEERQRRLAELLREPDPLTMLRALQGPVVPVPFELAEKMAEHERALGGKECKCEMCTHVRAIASPALPEI